MPVIIRKSRFVVPVSRTVRATNLGPTHPTAERADAVSLGNPDCGARVPGGSAFGEICRPWRRGYFTRVAIEGSARGFAGEYLTHDFAEAHRVNQSDGVPLLESIGERYLPVGIIQ